MSCGKLSEIGEAKREEIRQRNTYHNSRQFSQSNYIGTKGTGIKFDTSGGGDSIDMLSRSEIYRQNTYNPNNKYNCTL
jgi:hypothetical protein